MTATLTRQMPSRPHPARSVPVRTAAVDTTRAARRRPARPVPAVQRSTADFGHYRYSGYSADVAFDVVLPRSIATIYLRRRVVAALVFTATMLLLWLGAGNVLASRGGDPASVPATRPGATHVVQPGETLWSIAGEHRGASSQFEYVEDLIDLNGSTIVAVGQVVELP